MALRKPMMGLDSLLRSRRFDMVVEIESVVFVDVGAVEKERAFGKGGL